MAAIEVIAFGAAAYLVGDLTMANLPIAVCQDLANLLNATQLPCSTLSPEPATMPLLRDVFSGILLLSAVLTPYLVYKQWTGFDGLVPTLESRHIIESKQTGIDGLKSLKDEVERINTYFQKHGSSSLTPAFVAALAMAALMSGERTEIYRFLGPSGVEPWSAEIFAHWWANPQNNSLAWLLYFMVGFIAVYYVVRMNLVGGRVVLGIWRVRKDVLFGLDLDNLDGNYGWKPVMRMLTATYSALLLHGLGLLSLMVLLSIPKWFLLVPLLGQWLLVLPFYLFVPIYVVVRDVTEYKRRREAEIVALLSAVPVNDHVQRAALSQRLEAIRKLPVAPFKKWWTLRKVLGGFIAIGLTLYTAFQLIW
ncbi:hypothetical protein ACWFPY_25185 [Nocardia fluminea]